MKRLNLKKKVLIWVLAVIVLGLCGFLPTANAQSRAEQALALAKIRKDIKAKGAKWTASETAISKLSREQAKKLCGTSFIPGSEVGAPGDEIATTYETEFDWRENGIVTPIRDQMNCGSCWAFAATGAMELLLKINGISAGDDLSEQFVVSCNTQNNGCCGGSMGVVYDFLRDTGTTDEECFEYTSDEAYHTVGRSGRCVDDSELCPSGCNYGGELNLERISGWVPVPYSVDALKDAVENAPVSVAMTVYEDFRYYDDGIYEHVSGGVLGGHAVILIGWGVESDTEYWICKNSWGSCASVRDPDTGEIILGLCWGEGYGDDDGGYFRIKIGDSDIGSAAGQFSYASPCLDADGDGYFDDTCGGTDCNDTDEDINPEALDSCDENNIDNNCDGADGIPEVCDGKDNDCDEFIDEDLGTTTCGLGECEHTINNCVGEEEQECDPMEGSSAEVCDGKDNDCDGSIDEDLGTTTCGVGECEVTVQNCYNGALQTCTEGTPSVEICDDLDNDCDGLTDEGGVCPDCAGVGESCEFLSCCPGLRCHPRKNYCR